MKRKYFFSLCLAALLAAAAGSWATAPATEASGNSPVPVAATRLTCDQALAIARTNNRPYLIAAHAKTAAAAAWWQSVLRFGPSAGLQFGYLLDNKPMVTSFDMNGMPISLEVAPNYYAGQLVVSQPIFTGFKLWNGMSLARLQMETAEAEYALAASQLKLDVTEAYFGLKVAEDLLQVTQDFIRQTEGHLQVVKAQYRDGSVSNYDVLRSEVQLANLQPQLLQVQTGLELARKKLAMVLGLPLATPIQATEEIAVAPVELPPLQPMLDQSVAQRLELKNLERTTRMADIGHAMAVSSNLPNVAVSGTWTYYDSQDKTYPPQNANLLHSWQIMLGLDWPIWDNLAVIPKTIEAAAKVRQSELGLKSLEDGIRLEVEALYLGLQASQETLAAQQKTIEQAQAGQRIAEQQYAAGHMTNLDVMDAQLALNQAKVNFLQTKLACLLGQIKLKKAVGEKLE